MTHFFCKLIAPRPTFAQDMTEEEAALMREHGAYWRALAERGIAVAFGPVADPKGAWGMGILNAKDEAELDTLHLSDPVIKSGRGFRYETYPMLNLVVGKVG